MNLKQAFHSISTTHEFKPGDIIEVYAYESRRMQPVSTVE